MPRSQAHAQRNQNFRNSSADNDKTRSLATPTGELIHAQARELGAKWEVEDVPEGRGARIHWVGEKSARIVILYFHGGGFGLPIFRGNVLFFHETHRLLAETGKDVVLAFLEYGLTPKVKYPTQYIQGTKALAHIIKLGYLASDIIIGGGSAGGNLALAVLSHSLHPHPDIAKLTIPSPLRGLFLISPWVSFSTKAKSFEENKQKDMFNVSSMTQFAADFANPAERNNYSEPIRAEPDWWKQAPVENVLLVTGAEEMFRDDIVNFAETLGNADVNLEFVLCENETHVECTLEAQFGMEAGVMTNSVRNWLDRLL